MTIEEFLTLLDDGLLSSEDAQLLNKELGNISALDIPWDKKADVAEYLATSLNLGSVELSLVPSLDALLAGLQESRTA